MLTVDSKSVTVWNQTCGKEWLRMFYFLILLFLRKIWSWLKIRVRQTSGPPSWGFPYGKKNRDVQRRQDTKQLTENSPLCRISHIADLPGPVLNPSKDLRSHLGWTSLITPDKAVITDPYPSPSLWCPHTQPSAKYKIRLVFPMWARPWPTVLIHLSG